MSELADYMDISPFPLSTANGQSLFLWITFGGELTGTRFEMTYNEIRNRVAIYEDGTQIYSNYSETPTEEEFKEVCSLLYGELDDSPELMTSILESRGMN